MKIQILEEDKNQERNYQRLVSSLQLMWLQEKFYLRDFRVIKGEIEKKSIVD